MSIFSNFPNLEFLTWGLDTAGVKGIKLTKSSLAKVTYDDGLVIPLTEKPNYLSFYFSSSSTDSEDANVRVYKDNVNRPLLKF